MNVAEQVPVISVQNVSSSVPVNALHDAAEQVFVTLEELVLQGRPLKENKMAKKVSARKGLKLVRWTKAEDKELREHSKSKTPMKKVAKAMKGRSERALRQRASSLGIRLGHRRYVK